MKTEERLNSLEARVAWLELVWNESDEEDDPCVSREEVEQTKSAERSRIEKDMADKLNKLKELKAMPWTERKVEELWNLLMLGGSSMEERRNVLVMLTEKNESKFAEAPEEYPNPNNPLRL